VATDAARNSYVTGRFSGTVNFNPNGTNTSLTTLGPGDVFVAKYDSSNTLVWVKQMGGTGATAVGMNIAVDTSGNTYVAGNLTGTATFGSTQLSGSQGIAFVEKLDANGTVQWAKSIGTSGESEVGVGVDSSGNVYALGENWSASSNSKWTNDIFKFSPTGSTVWSETIYTHEWSGLEGFAVDGSGDVFVAGDFQGTVNFSPTGRSHYVTAPSNQFNLYPSGFVLELNTSGKFQWVSAFIGQGSSLGTASLASLTLDSGGNVIVGGSYGGTVNFNGSTTTLPTSGGALLAKLNSSGGLVWAEETAGVYLERLAVDSADNIYAISDGFVMKADTAGNVDWMDTFGGTGPAVRGIAVDSNNTIHLVGWYSGTANFNPDPNGPPDDLTSAGGNDAYLLTLTQS